ncbi:hypothetical protein E2320_012811 [Naja naja]|nr:hypothetical protein E2320_012811 [Naja naja]
MGLELYLDLLSQPCRAVYLFAKKNHIPFELKNVELFKDSILGTKVSGAEAEGGATHPSGSQRKETTRMKKVPILKDETFILSEGMAILLYLSRKYNTPDHWYPSDLQKRAKVDEYLSWHQATIRSNAPKTMWIKVLIPLLTGQPLPPEKLQEVMDGLATALDHFEGLFLQDKPFLPVGVGCDIFKDRPRLAEWRKRMEDVIGKELFLQAHELILNISKLSTIQIDPQLKEQLAPVLHGLSKGCPPGGSGKGLARLATGLLVPSANQMPEVSVGAAHLLAVPRDGAGAVPGPAFPALQGGLHLCQKEQHPFHDEACGDAKRWWRGVNILRKVPVLKDGDFILEESEATAQESGLSMGTRQKHWLLSQHAWLCLSKAEVCA